MDRKSQTIESSNSNSMVYKNSLPGTGCEKLYLDIRTSDVTFIFPTSSIGDDDCVKLPAHKAILSASPVFDAMFFGPVKEPGMIRIVDVAPEAFKEFLQFFYLTRVKLNADHLISVMNLGKKYMITECLIACTEFFMATLTLENMCWGYELAILFDLHELRRFCEQKICQHPCEMFRSNSFLDCDMNLLRSLLQLTALECNEVTIFDGCMAWAKKSYAEKSPSLQFNASELRTELHDLFYEIRFGEFTHKQFHDRYRLYDGLFSLEEFRDITMMISNKEFQPTTKFKRCARAQQTATTVAGNDVHICDRKAINHTVWYTVDRCEHSNLCIDKTVFESNVMQKLKRFWCSVKFQGIGAAAKIRISDLDESGRRNNLLFFSIVMLSSTDETIIELPAPIVIQSDTKYEIEIELEAGLIYSSELVRNNVRMDNGNVITFLGKQLGMQSLVKSLQFCEIVE